MIENLLKKQADFLQSSVSWSSSQVQDPTLGVVELQPSVTEEPVFSEEPVTWQYAQSSSWSNILSSGFQPPNIRQKPTPLHEAAQIGDIPKIHKLIAEGWDVNQEDRLSGMPIHVAAINGNLNVVKVLIQYGADLKDKTYMGDTALGLAVSHGHSAVVQELIDAGAKATEKQHAFKTPLDLAVEQLNDLTDKLLDNPKDTANLANAKELVNIVKVLSTAYEPNDFNAAFEKVDGVPQAQPVSLILDTFSGYIQDASLRGQMQSLSKQLASQNTTQEAYINAKNFLNVFSNSSQQFVKIAEHKIVSIHTDGHVKKYILGSIQDTMAKYSSYLNKSTDILGKAATKGVLESVKNAATYADAFADLNTAQKAYSDFCANKTLLLASGWKGHAVSVMFSKEHNVFAIAHASKVNHTSETGITFFKLSDPSVVTPEIIHDFLTNQDKNHFELNLFYKLGTPDLTGSISTLEQKVDNCTYYNSKIAIEGLYFIEFLKQGIDFETSGNLASKYSQNWETYHNASLIHDMLQSKDTIEKSFYEKLYQNLKSHADDNSVAEKTAEFLKHEFKHAYHINLEGHEKPGILTQFKNFLGLGQSEPKAELEISPHFTHQDVDNLLHYGEESPDSQNLNPVLDQGAELAFMDTQDMYTPVALEVC